jgi:hypothetical protein
MDAGRARGALVSLQKGRTAHVPGRRNFYSDPTAKRWCPMRAASQRQPTTSLETCMEPLTLAPRNFMNLLREEAGMSFMEFALLGSLVVFVGLLLLFAARRSA